MLCLLLIEGEGLLKFWQMIQIENRAEESDDGEDDDHAAYYLIDDDDAVGIKLIPNLVDEPR